MLAKQSSSAEKGGKSTIHTPFFQPKPASSPGKLTVNTPGDAHEREADRVADEVMRMPALPAFSGTGGGIAGGLGDDNSATSMPIQRTPIPIAPVQRMCDDCEKEEQEQVQRQEKTGATWAGSDPVLVQRKESPSPKGEGSTAPPIVSEVLSSGGGNALDADTKGFMESRFGQDFSQVRIHTGGRAAESAASIQARAYTSGRDVVFGAGEYQPSSERGRRLLAHELVHVGQQGGARHWVARQGGGAAQPAAARPDVFYIMGEDRRGSRNQFFTTALRFYRARFPNATFVTNIRNLHDLLNHVVTNFRAPIGNLFIVSHANEDGTLSFGLNASDRDHLLSVTELRAALHPAGGARSSLPQIGNQIDSQTRIKIKGCDIGRTRQMVELIDESFGGRGTVSAPTHEQGYDFSGRRSAAAGREAFIRQRITAFEATLPAIPPMPAPVDRRLRGEARQEAIRERNEAVRQREAALRQRRSAIRSERARITPEAERAGQITATSESLSGPMFQRRGTNLFTERELRPQVDTLYPHLSNDQRGDLVRRLIAPDRRRQSVALSQGVFQQQGQRAYSIRVPFTFVAPQTFAQVRRALARNFAQSHFAPTALVSTTPQVNGDETTFHYHLEGHDSRRGRQRDRMTFDATSSPVRSDQSLINEIRRSVNNPDKFNWRVESRTSANGTLTKTVIRERVVAYLHHGSLNQAANRPFMPAESDARFFTTSTFAPPPPAPPRRAAPARRTVP